MNYRDVTGYAREPLQQSMVRPSRDYPHLNAVSLEVGVILAVYPADSSYNRTRMESRTKRGWRHECSVHLVGSGQGGETTITGVVIPPPSPSGVHNFDEALPKGCTQTLREDGTFDPNLNFTSPEELDGDWCVVGYIRNDRDQPFIVSWWPNPNNTLDVSTSGQGNPNASGEGTALDQVGRSMSRVNGVEKTITKQGNVYFDTSLAGDSINFRKPTKNGRYARQRAEAGGNIRVVVKTSAAVEIDFNDPPNGIGVLDQPDPQITQENPPPANASQIPERKNTYLMLNKDVLQLTCSSNIKLKAPIIEFYGSERLKVDSPEISLGRFGTNIAIKASSVETDADTVSTTTSAFTIDDGSGAYLPLLNKSVADAWKVGMVDVASAVATAAAPTATPANVQAAVVAIGKFLTSMTTALGTGQTITLKST